MECNTCHYKMACPKCSGLVDNLSVPTQNSELSLIDFNDASKQECENHEEEKLRESSPSPGATASAKDEELTPVATVPTKNEDSLAVPPVATVPTKNEDSLEDTSVATVPTKNEESLAEATASKGKKPGNRKSFKILITGKSGTSKSVIINGLLGKYLIEERRGVVSEPRSESLEYYHFWANGIHYNVWSSPHLQDNDKRINIPNYLQHLKRACSNVDLIIYTLNMTETRFLPGNPDSIAMAKLTSALGEDCWKKTIFVMTFANVAASVNFCPVGDESKEMKEEAFKNGLSMWKKVIEDTLKVEAGIKKELDIKVVPAGHYKNPILPDRDNWLADLWISCCESMPEEAQEKLIELNISRFQSIQSFSSAEIREMQIFEQPIRLAHKFKNKTIKIFKKVANKLGNKMSFLT